MGLKSCYKEAGSDLAEIKYYTMEDASAALGFHAKEEIVQTLISLGFSRNAAIKVNFYFKKTAYKKRGKPLKHEI